MKKPLRKARSIKVKRSLRDIENFDLAPIVNTKLSKKEYELRRDIFDYEYYETYDPERTGWLKERSYDDYVEWGGLGGRPVKWKNEAERKKASRIKGKLIANQPLKEKDKIFLKTLNPDLVNEILSGAKEHKIGRPRQYHFDRPATVKERKQQQREREKLKDEEEED